MKADLYNHESRWEFWKEDHENKNIEGLTKKTSDLVKQYLFDMERGENVSTRNKRGGRSTSRLNKIAYTLTWVLVKLRENYNLSDVTKATSSQFADLFRNMRDGKLLTQRGTKFKSTADYIKITKAFWHWYQKINRKNGVFIDDITEDLDAKYDEKPVWVYLKNDQMDKLIKECRGYYRPLISFLFDSGARPTETFSLLVEDISQDDKGTIYANIRNEISKGGNCGRKIKLLLSGKEILEYIKINNLKPSDQLFFQSNAVVNRYISSLAEELFGDRNSEAGNNYKNLSLYDFRHNSCCYWLQRYKNNANLMYRFGWKTEKYIHYYSEFLGLKDQISEEDLFVDITKTELEKELKRVKKELHNRVTKEDMMELFSQVMQKAGIESLKEMKKIHEENLKKSETAWDVLNA